MKIKRAPSSTHNYYDHEWQCYRHIVAAIMYRAFQDAAGVIESTGEVTRRKSAIMQDGAAYFEDGRFEYHAELIGLDPTLRPDWKNEGE